MIKQKKPTEGTKNKYIFFDYINPQIWRKLMQQSQPEKQEKENLSFCKH